MDILFMADVAPNPNAGAAGTELRTIDALRGLGHRVEAIWSDALGRRISHGNLHYALELPRAYRAAMLRALARQDFDAIHVNQPHGWLAARTFQRSSRPGVFVHRSHGFEPHVDEVVRRWARTFGQPPRPLLNRMAGAPLHAALDRHNRLIAKWADGHIVSATADAAFLAERFGVDRERIAVIPQAASSEFLSQPLAAFDADRLRRVLYVGQFAFVKAPMVVAAAMSELARDPSLELTWVCDRAHHPAARALLRTDRVTLLDWMDTSALIGVYDRHGVFLFPSFFEGFGKAFLEAMSRGLCVVATDAGGMHDVIANGRSGLLVPPGDAAAVVDAVRTLQRDLGRASAMSAEAAAVARAYTWERTARETAAFYEALRKRKTA